MAEKNMNAKISVEFEETANRQQLSSGDNLPTLFGKIKKFFIDLKAVAFSGSYIDLSDRPTTATTDTDGLMSAEDKTKLDDADNTYALKSKYGDTTINVGRKDGSDIGERSTAEGYNTIASGYCSHAEGRGTTASSFCSHAGGYNTTALHNHEVAYGRYNESNNNTLFSIGDGTADDARHNAFEITTTGGKLHDKDIATTDDIPDLSPYAKTADIPDIKVNSAVDADTVGGLNPDVFSKTKIMATDIFGITDQYGKLKLWSASEFKRPICAEFTNLYAIPCSAADSDTFYYYYVVLMNADTHDCIPNTPVSGTIYYIDVREVTT